jgi:tRNA (guanine37-N1)-methyltransferase|tara:strand:- start:16508 stop:17251 length:744 start_codon:yes stop_codon:yes gene_type:complete
LTKLNIGIVSLFPEMIHLIAQYGVVGRSADEELLTLSMYNPRDFTTDAYHKVDDKPYGGGPGMVMKFKPLESAIKSAKKSMPKDCPVILMSPQGRRFDQKVARRFSKLPAMILVAGRYEGVDERFIENHVDEEISMGDFILSGGEIAAMAIIDSVVRLLPGALGDDASSVDESFENNLLEYPHYTRPEEVEGHSVPEVLLSGNHEAIKLWRSEQSLIRTYKKRPDLLDELTEQQEIILNKYKQLIKD